MSLRRPALLAVLALLSGLCSLVSPALSPAARAATPTTWAAGDLAMVSTNSGFTGNDRFPARIRPDGTVTRVGMSSLQPGEAIRAGTIGADGTLYLLTSRLRVVTVAANGAETVLVTFETAFYPDTAAHDLAVLPDGTLAVLLRRRDNTSDLVRLAAGGAIASTTNLPGVPVALDADPAGNLYYLLQSGSDRILFLRRLDGSTSGLATFGTSPAAPAGQAVDLAVDAGGTSFVLLNRGGGAAEVVRLAPQSGYATTVIASRADSQRGNFGGIAVTTDGTVSWTQYASVGGYQEGVSYPATLYRTPGADTASTSDVTSTELGASYYIPRVVAFPARADSPFGDPVDATISGTPKVGELLTGSAGSYTPSDATIGYSWKVGDDVVSTTSTYTPKLADAGKPVSLTVTGTRSGFTASTDTETSGAIATIRGFTGTLKVGQTLTLSDTAGTVVGWALFSDAACATTAGSATGSTLVLAAADEGRYVQAMQKVGSRTGRGSCEGPIAAATQPFTTKPTVSVSGTATVGAQLSAVVSGGAPTAASTTKTYRWLADGNVVGGATSSTFTPTAAQRGAKISVEVTSTATVSGIDYSDTTTSAQTAAVVQDFGSSPSVILAVRDRRALEVGESLDAIVNGGSPDASSTTKTYRWFRDGVLVPTATGSSYPLTAADEGAKINVEVTSRSDGFVDDVTSSTQSSVVGTGTFSIGAPTISGTRTVGSTLSCAAAQGTPGEASYLWKRGTTEVGSGSAYDLVPADRANGSVTCVVTAKRQGYTDASSTASSGPIGAGTFTIAAPSISGTRAVGATLTCAAAGGTVGEVSYAWFRGEVLVGTGDAYAPTATDRGETLRCEATSERDGYADASSSTTSGPIGFGTFAIDAPVVSGTETVGSTLTCAAAFGTPGGVTYAWLRGQTQVGTGATYVLAPEDRTNTVTCVVTSERDGYTDATNEADSGQIGAGSFTIDAPSISGTESVGSTLTCAAANGTPGEVSFEWFRGETSVGTDATYELVADDVDERLTCVVTSEREGYDDASAEADSGSIGAGTFTIGSPSISGVERVGETLTCVAADGTPGTASVEWFRGESSVGTGSSYELVADDEDGVVTCVVTAERDGYVDAANEVDSGVVGAGTFTIGAPSISGSERVGETLTCASASGTIGAVSYAWTRGNDPTVLASSALYSVAPGDLGATLRCTVTSVRDGYTDAVASADSGPVEAGAAGRYEVRVEGLRGADGDEPRVRRPLQAVLDGATGAPAPSAVSWQWYADGAPVAGATRARFNPGIELLGARLRVVATISADGYEQTTGTARITRPVILRPLVFAFDQPRVAGGERVGFVATNLVPGQRWQLVSLLDDAVLTRGTVGADNEELTGTVLVPKRYAGRERVFAFRTTGPDRGVLDRITVR